MNSIFLFFKKEYNCLGINIFLEKIEKDDMINCVGSKFPFEG